jgi:hypothetical protein
VTGQAWLATGTHKPQLHEVQGWWLRNLELHETLVGGEPSIVLSSCPYLLHAPICRCLTGVAALCELFSWRTEMPGSTTPHTTPHLDLDSRSSQSL